MIKIDIKNLEYILKITPASQNIMLVGPHGIGKSKILENYFKKEGFKVVTLFLGQMSDGGDLIGLPHKNEKTGITEFLPPYWFPVDNKPIVLFLDELNRARPEILQIILDLALNRKLAGKSLPEGSRIISAVNDGDQYTLTEIDPALLSRFNCYQFTPSVGEWLKFAEENGLNQKIIDFIAENPDMLDGTQFQKSISGIERTPDRRSWERLSEVMENMTDFGQMELNVMSGIVGTAAATKFFASTSQHRILTASDILLGLYFEDLKPSLKKYSVPEMAIINESIFRFMESANYAESEQRKVFDNLDAYVDFIIHLESKEIGAHFVNMFTAANYPQAVVSISSKCKRAYMLIKEFIAGINND